MAGFPTHSTGFSDALVILGAAGIVIPAFARFRINPVIGFILVGLAVGPHGLGVLVPRDPWLLLRHDHRPARDRAVRRVRHRAAAVLDRARTVVRRLWSMRRQVFGVGAAELFCARR